MLLKGWMGCVLVLALGAADAAGQERVSLSLSDALARAQETSEGVAIAEAGVLRGRGEQLRARSQYFPQLSATVGYSRALASEFEGLFNGGQDTTASSPGGGTNGDGIDFGELPFGRENTWQVGLQLSQNLFAGGRIRAQNRIAASARSTAGIGLESARAQAQLEMATAYYDAALSERLLAIAEATLEQAEETLRQVRLGREVGQQPEFELLRAQVQRDNQVPVVIRQRSQRDLAVLRLKQLLEIGPEVELALSTPLEEAEPLPSSAAAESATLPKAAERAPVRQAEQSVRLQEASLDVVQAQRLPSISLSSSYTRVNYPVRLAPELGDFRTNWTLGLSLQLPLFTGGRIGGDERVAEAELAAARARLRQTVELTELDTRGAEQQLAAAVAAWRASAGTVEQAERAYAIAELRYAEGVSTQLELSDARILLQQAQATRAAAARELQVARMRVALLPDLPLGVGSAGVATAGTVGAAAAGGAGGNTGTGGAQRGPGGTF